MDICKTLNRLKWFLGCIFSSFFFSFEVLTCLLPDWQPEATSWPNKCPFQSARAISGAQKGLILQLHNNTLQNSGFKAPKFLDIQNGFGFKPQIEGAESERSPSEAAGACPEVSSKLKLNMGLECLAAGRHYMEKVQTEVWWLFLHVSPHLLPSCLLKDVLIVDFPLFTSASRCFLCLVIWQKTQLLICIGIARIISFWACCFREK